MLRTLTILAPALVGGCLANNGGDAPMIVLQNTAVQTGGTCSFNGQKGQAGFSQGIISTLSPTAYLVAPLIESRIKALTGEESQKSILLQGADVSLSVASTTVNGTSGAGFALTGANGAFKALFSGVVEPNAGTTNVTFGLVPAGA